MNTFKTSKGTELPILDLRGKPYLQVPHRIVWFREDHPEWVITVEFLEKTDKYVLAKASVFDETGKLRAAAHKVEHYAHFADALEKAETSSIGRALAMIGYGTQFAPDINEDDRIVDTPIKPPQAPAKPAHPPQQFKTKEPAAKPKTQNQAPIGMARSADLKTKIKQQSSTWTNEKIDEFIGQETGKQAHEMTEVEAVRIYDYCVKVPSTVGL